MMFLEISTLKHSQTYSWALWPSITDYLSISAGYGHNLPAIVCLTIEDSLEKLEMRQVSNRRHCPAESLIWNHILFLL
jgi:hypothetical protein